MCTHFWAGLLSISVPPGPASTVIRANIIPPNTACDWSSHGDRTVTWDNVYYPATCILPQGWQQNLKVLLDTSASSCDFSCLFSGATLSFEVKVRTCVHARMCVCMCLCSRIPGCHYELRECCTPAVLRLFCCMAQCSPILKRDEVRLDTFHHQCLRDVLRVSRLWQQVQHLNNIDPRRLWGDAELVSDIIRRRRLEWLGHVARMPENCCISLL